MLEVGKLSEYPWQKRSANDGNKKDHEQFESIIDITDSGPGIDPQLLEGDRLFSKFNSNDPVSAWLYISRLD